MYKGHYEPVLLLEYNTHCSVCWLQVVLNIAVFGNGGFKDNFYNVKFDNACSFLMGAMPKETARLSENVKLDLFCPIKAVISVNCILLMFIVSLQLCSRHLTRHHLMLHLCYIMLQVIQISDHLHLFSKKRRDQIRGVARGCLLYTSRCV